MRNYNISQTKQLQQNLIGQFQIKVNIIEPSSVTDFTLKMMDVIFDLCDHEM